MKRRLLAGFLLTYLLSPFCIGRNTSRTQWPKRQRLQQRNFGKLVDIGGEIQLYQFPYLYLAQQISRRRPRQNEGC
jgi:hypothetical protein